MGRFFWLKLKKDFFKRHDLLNLRSMENGLTYEAIFIHLMTEAIDHDGYLRYSEKKAYTARTLAPLASTDENTMKDALEAFEDLELIETLKDGTIYVPLSMANMGFEVDNANANRQRRYRERHANVTNNNACVTENNADVTHDVINRNESIEYRVKSIEYRDKKEEIDNDKSLSLSSRAREIPKKDDVIKFAHDHKLNRVIDVDAWYDFYSEQEWKIKGEDIQDWKALLMKWASNVKDRKNIETPFLENEYSEEHLKKKEEESLSKLDELLKEGE